MEGDYSEEFLEARKAALEQRRDEILGSSRQALHEIMDQEHEVGDSVDTSTEEQGTSTMLRLKDREQRQLHQIVGALERLQDDEYGECAECGELINPRRLKAQPTARLCIGCQEERERRDRTRTARPGLIDEYM